MIFNKDEDVGVIFEDFNIINYTFLWEKHLDTYYSK